MLILPECLLEEDGAYKYIDKTDRTKELVGAQDLYMNGSGFIRNITI